VAVAYAGQPLPFVGSLLGENTPGGILRPEFDNQLIAGRLTMKTSLEEREGQRLVGHGHVHCAVPTWTTTSFEGWLTPHALWATTRTKYVPGGACVATGEPVIRAITRSLSPLADPTCT
jgi:hypothetical protein